MPRILRLGGNFGIDARLRGQVGCVAAVNDVRLGAVVLAVNFNPNVCSLFGITETWDEDTQRRNRRTEEEAPWSRRQVEKAPLQ